MKPKEICDKIREICIELEKKPWNKAGIYKDTPVLPTIPVGLDKYNEIKNDVTHPLNQYIIAKNK